MCWFRLVDKSNSMIIDCDVYGWYNYINILIYPMIIGYTTQISMDAKEHAESALQIAKCTINYA